MPGPTLSKANFVHLVSPVKDWPFPKLDEMIIMYSRHVDSVGPDHLCEACKRHSVRQSVCMFNIDMVVLGRYVPNSESIEY